MLSNRNLPEKFGVVEIYRKASMIFIGRQRETKTYFPQIKLKIKIKLYLGSYVQSNFRLIFQSVNKGNETQHLTVYETYEIHIDD